MSRKARALVADDDNEVFLSAASVWEITTKARLGKLPRALAVAADVPGAMASQGFAPLSWSVPSTSTTKDQRLVGAEVAVLGAPRHDLADGVEGYPGRRLDEAGRLGSERAEGGG